MNLTKYRKTSYPDFESAQDLKFKAVHLQGRCLPIAIWPQLICGHHGIYLYRALLEPNMTDLHCYISIRALNVMFVSLLNGIHGFKFCFLFAEITYQVTLYPVGFFSPSDISLTSPASQPNLNFMMMNLALTTTSIRSTRQCMDTMHK